MGSLDLTGVIGTWVAVGLALIALIGLIPLYIGYRKRTSTRAQAIAKIDDPNQDFVTKGWTILPGLRLFGRFNMPDLRNPPNIRSIIVNMNRRPELFTRPRGSKSSTGWINFLNIPRIYDVIDPEHAEGGESRDPQVRLRFDREAVYGLSGVMSQGYSGEDEEQRDERDVVCFNIHPLP